jgi:hypothetical protein
MRNKLAMVGEQILVELNGQTKKLAKLLPKLTAKKVPMLKPLQLRLARTLLMEKVPKERKMDPKPNP